MAYKGAYNPDALPAHAEPEQAAQLLGAMRVSKPNQPQPQPQLQNRGHHPAQSGPPARKVSPNPPPPPKDYPPVSSATSPAPTTHPLYQKHGGMDTNNSRLYSPPPPQNYGSGPRPVPAQNRPPPTSHPPRSPQPPQASPPGMPKSDDPRDLFPLFRAANSSNTGSLSRTELGSALVNGDYTSFDPYTVTMMIRMFDRDGNGTVGFDEFVALWRFLAAWRELFVRFDEDNSGRISLQEFTNALAAFGYRLSQPFIGLMFTTFESKGRGKAGPISGQKDGMSFDLFVQACITLKRMTDAFKRYDDDRDGYITLSFEEFLTEVLRLRE